MFKNTPFEAIAKTMSESAAKFNPAALQDSIKPVQDSQSLGRSGTKPGQGSASRAV